jgi:hypothetical protein
MTARKEQSFLDDAVALLFPSVEGFEASCPIAKEKVVDCNWILRAQHADAERGATASHFAEFLQSRAGVRGL